MAQETRSDSCNVLKILLLTEGSAWIAQCLQFDITAQGRSYRDALDRLQVLFWAEHYQALNEDRTPFSNLDKAPERYWVMFEKGAKIIVHLKLPPIPDESLEPDVKLAEAA
jgi:hypothetical protein